ncbi:cyclic nucleotide-binding domain-containing protein [Rhodobacteraceae bacterium RKSG542]|uniref:cyclic nucleotide-gated ion channel n=1 Tax=Pseudovibrio flavus TaxID=2529854 RepID=UPI0012BBF0B6|nr:cyclic nucleotide-gated ion channel [Pseudovibrio flavus]MTI19293.1 cyclic nucleotide-binding domain-containing protein [Pseudovibrio flavus]
MAQALKETVYNILEKSSSGNVYAQWTNRVLVTLIVLTVGAAVLETEPDIGPGWQKLILFLDVAAGAIFLIEYILRLWVANIYPPFRRYGVIKSRLMYAIQPMAIIDLISVMPFILALFFGEGSWKAFLILRLLRFFKIARYSPAMKSLVTAISVERRAILASIVIILGAILMAATGMYFVERHVQPEKLGTIPDAMWWAFVTLTTVGYGDVVPVTAAGKVLASVVMLTGYCLFALPVGIVGTAFVREINSRDFVVTWGMVATVPAFENLAAREIAELADLLRARSVGDGFIITEPDDPADELYFVASGEVLVEEDGEETSIGVGDYFGQLALHGISEEGVRATAIGEVQLMVLEMDDLRRFMDMKPNVAKHIFAKARKDPAYRKRVVIHDKVYGAGTEKASKARAASATEKPKKVPPRRTVRPPKSEGSGNAPDGDDGGE